MSAVDPYDDSLRRWVLEHYRFDPRRRQRRNVVVAAYDDQREFESAMKDYDIGIRAEIEAGERDSQERVSGVLWDQGHHAAQALGRLVRDAVRHGVDPRPFLADGRLPPNVALFGWDDDGDPWTVGGDPQTPPAH